MLTTPRLTITQDDITMASAQDEKQISARYVTALFALAQEQKKQDTVAEELSALANLLNTSAEFKSLCFSPALSAATKLEAVAAIAKKLKLSALTNNFLNVLAENQRLPLLAAVAEDFLAALRESKGEIVAEILTATKLDSKTEKSLVESLSKYTGKTVSLQVTEKPELLGGLQIRLGGVMIDASVLGKLNRLKEKLTNGIRAAA